MSVNCEGFNLHNWEVITKWNLENAIVSMGMRWAPPSRTEEIGKKLKQQSKTINKHKLIK